MPLYKLSLNLLLVTFMLVSSGKNLRAPPDPLWYLNKFGYLNNYRAPKKTGSLRMLISDRTNVIETLPDDVHEAVKNFQEHAGLSPTGKLDNETLTMMRLPRCGHLDNLSKSSRRNKRYFFCYFKFKKYKIYLNIIIKFV